MPTFFWRYHLAFGWNNRPGSGQACWDGKGSTAISTVASLSRAIDRRRDFRRPRIFQLVPFTGDLSFAFFASCMTSFVRPVISMFPAYVVGFLLVPSSGSSHKHPKWDPSLGPRPLPFLGCQPDRKMRSRPIEPEGSLMARVQFWAGYGATIACSAREPHFQVGEPFKDLDSSFVLDLEPPRVPSEACFGRLEIDSQSARLISPLFLSSPFLSIYFSPACPGRSRVDMELQAWTPQRKLGHISSDLVRFLLQRLRAHGLNLHAYTRKMVGGHGKRSHLNSYPCFSDVFGVCRSHTRGPSWLRRSYGEQAENRVWSQSI